MAYKTNILLFSLTQNFTLKLKIIVIVFSEKMNSFPKFYIQHNSFKYLFVCFWTTINMCIENANFVTHIHNLYTGIIVLKHLKFHTLEFYTSNFVLYAELI